MGTAGSRRRVAGRLVLSNIEGLERRTLFSTVLGLTADNELVTFDSANPSVTSTPVAINGLGGGETIKSLDVRTATGTLIGVSSANQVYTINPTTGEATAVGSAFTPTLTGTHAAIDINPVVDRVRVVTDTDQNLRLNPVTGASVATDSSLAYAGGDTNAAANPNVVALAYSNNVSGATTTTLYGLDATTDALVLQGSVDGTPTSPNLGILTTVGAIGFDMTDGGFDIAPDGRAIAALNTATSTQTAVYSINLSTGAATLVGETTGVVLSDIAILADAPILYAVSTTNKLLKFSASDPGTPLAITSITGLNVSDNIVGLDFRPSTGVLYALGNQQIYTINTTTAVATPVGGPLSPGLAGPGYDFDFNPQSEVIRAVSGGDTNLRIDPDTGLTTFHDTALAYDTGDVNFGQDPDVNALTYTNNYPGSTTTTLYGIDIDRDALVMLGGPDGSTFPADGKLTTIGALGVDAIGAGIEQTGGPGSKTYVTITASGGTTSQLYTIDLATGTLSLVGTIGGGEIVNDIAVGIPGEISFSSADFGVAESAGTASVTLTRSGGSSGRVSVFYSSFDQVATAATNDYTPVSGTITFEDGETTKTISIPILEDTVYEGSETILLGISTPSGGASIGSGATATVTIADNEPIPVVSISGGSVTEGALADGVAPLLPFTVALSTVSELPVTVDYTTSDGTATNTSDYVASSGTITFAPGETTKTISITTVLDDTLEPDETVKLTLSNVTNANLGAATATGLIRTDESGAFSTPISGGGNAVVVVGTSGADSLTFVKTKKAVTSMLNNIALGTFKNVKRLTVFGGDGDDTITIGNLGVGVVVLGGTGNDQVTGGGKSDVLIGGDGADTILGGKGQDILIDGSTLYDADPTALFALRTVWLNTSLSYNTRVTRVQTGTKVTGSFAFNDTTLIDDGDIDILTGEKSNDLFLTHTNDNVTDKATKETNTVR